MKAMNRRGWGKAVGGFALGAAAGSTAALLFAPASGKATRKRMVLQLKSIERKAEQRILRAKKLLTRKAGLLRDNAVGKLEDTREWLEDRLGNHNHRQPAPRRLAHHS